MTAREWLLENGYADIDNLIDRVEALWAKSGAKTRRNWWDVLAGGVDGRSRTVEGIEFPVLRSAQVHEGRSVTKNAVQRNKKEKPPEKSYRGRSIRKRG